MEKPFGTKIPCSDIFAYETRRSIGKIVVRPFSPLVFLPRAHTHVPRTRCARRKRSSPTFFSQYNLRNPHVFLSPRTSRGNVRIRYAPESWPERRSESEMRREPPAAEGDERSARASPIPVSLSLRYAHPYPAPPLLPPHLPVIRRLNNNNNNKV